MPPTCRQRESQSGLLFFEQLLTLAACSSSHRASPEASSSSSDGNACEPAKLVRLHQAYASHCWATKPAPVNSSCFGPMRMDCSSISG